MSSIRRILVTGGSGRIGKAIMSDLVAQSYDVVNVDVVDADFVDTVIADLVLPQEYLKIKGSFDAIVHLAGLPSLRNATPQEVFMVNTSTAHNVLEFAYQNEIRKVIMASSEAVIGLANSYLIVRPVILPVDEAHPLLAQDAYGLSKGVQEQIALARTPLPRNVYCQSSVLLGPVSERLSGHTGRYTRRSCSRRTQNLLLCRHQGRVQCRSTSHRMGRYGPRSAICIGG